EMVMMIFAGHFKARWSLIKMTLGQQLAFLQQLESPINRCIADVRIDFLHFSIKFFRTDMATEVEENPGYIIAWRSGFQTAVSQARMEQFQPLVGLGESRMLGHRVIRLSVGHVIT